MRACRARNRRHGAICARQICLRFRARIWRTFGYGFVPNLGQVRAAFAQSLRAGVQNALLYARKYQLLLSVEMRRLNAREIVIEHARVKLPALRLGQRQARRVIAILNFAIRKRLAVALKAPSLGIE